jgi:hypothetical protein
MSSRAKEIQAYATQELRALGILYPSTSDDISHSTITLTASASASDAQKFIISSADFPALKPRKPPVHHCRPCLAELCSVPCAYVESQLPYIPWNITKQVMYGYDPAEFEGEDRLMPGLTDLIGTTVEDDSLPSPSSSALFEISEDTKPDETTNTLEEEEKADAQDSTDDATTPSPSPPPLPSALSLSIPDPDTEWTFIQPYSHHSNHEDSSDDGTITPTITLTTIKPGTNTETETDTDPWVILPDDS